MKIGDFVNKKLSILGLGKEGLSSYYFFRYLFPNKILGFADILPRERLPQKIKAIVSQDKYLKLHLGQDYLKNLTAYDVIVKTPGISPRLPEIQKIISDKKKILTSQTEIFFDHFRGKIIGLTGTKGKSTTTSLIYHLLRRAGYKVALGGNIGRPPLALLRQSFNNVLNWAVLELSSH